MIAHVLPGLLERCALVRVKADQTVFGQGKDPVVPTFGNGEWRFVRKQFLDMQPPVVKP